MKKSAREKARYPKGYDQLKLMEENAIARALKFPNGEKFRTAQQFCTRYRLAASFDGIKIKAFVKDRTGVAYGALFHVFVCYTAFEMMSEAMSIPEKILVNSLTSAADNTAQANVLGAPASREFLVRLRDEHDPNKGKNVRKAIDEYLRSGTLPAVIYAKAIRNAFAHGRLPSAPGNVGARNVIKICTILSRYLLQLMNDQFDAFMR